ncbi:hypothetical protein EYF80_014374 [Liparis tanakae]|uniref:Uncharacterized protein n=1 Tax=Liparis tanakae TaxID=230148 RepID=A0A4Z2IBI3_9TELE|nr:hypothetical protein EYF80_014374 [Liparis tanakae]
MTERPNATGRQTGERVVALGSTGEGVSNISPSLYRSIMTSMTLEFGTDGSGRVSGFVGGRTREKHGAVWTSGDERVSGTVGLPSAVNTASEVRNQPDRNPLTGWSGPLPH